MLTLYKLKNAPKKSYREKILSKRGKMEIQLSTPLLEMVFLWQIVSRYFQRFRNQHTAAFLKPYLNFNFKVIWQLFENFKSTAKIFLKMNFIDVSVNQFVDPHSVTPFSFVSKNIKIAVRYSPVSMPLGKCGKPSQRVNCLKVWKVKGCLRQFWRLPMSVSSGSRFSNYECLRKI
jgi:hypothetical protein